MKSTSLQKGLPAEQWEKLISEAPGEDRLPTPEEEAAWEDGFVSYSLADHKAKLAARRMRGKGRKPPKHSVTVRYDADIIEAFKASGKGWQTLLNAAVRDWLRTHSPSDAVEAKEGT